MEPGDYALCRQHLNGVGIRMADRINQTDNYVECNDAFWYIGKVIRIQYGTAYVLHADIEEKAVDYTTKLGYSHVCIDIEEIDEHMLLLYAKSIQLDIGKTLDKVLQLVHSFCIKHNLQFLGRDSIYHY